MRGTLKGEELVQQANIVFDKVSKSNQKTRLIRLAEQLAVKCYNEYSKPFFQKTLDTARLNNDWDCAPWYRQVLHWLSSGYFRVERITRIDDIEDVIVAELAKEPFQPCFRHLEYLPPALMNTNEDSFFKNFIAKHLDKIVQDSGKEDAPITQDRAQVNATPANQNGEKPIVSEEPATQPRIVNFTVDDLLAGQVPADPFKHNASNGVQKVESPAREKPSVAEETEDSNSYSSLFSRPETEKDRELAAANRHAYFQHAAKDANKKDTLGKPTRKVEDIRSALFKGDLKSQQTRQNTIRARISAINYRTPTPEERDALFKASEEASSPTNQSRL